jgi:hypothetical protein
VSAQVAEKFMKSITNKPEGAIETSQGLNGSPPDQSELREKNQTARRLLREWLSDTSGYDEETWPQVKTLIEENRLSQRNRFSD